MVADAFGGEAGMDLNFGLAWDVRACRGVRDGDSALRPVRAGNAVS